MRRDKIEELIVRLIFEEVFSPEVVTYVSDRVNKALAHMLTTPGEKRRRLGDERNAVRRELDTVASAIRQGIVTPTTKMLLEAAERRFAECEAALAACEVSPQRIVALPSVVEG